MSRMYNFISPRNDSDDVKVMVVNPGGRIRYMSLWEAIKLMRSLTNKQEMFAIDSKPIDEGDTNVV